MRSSILRKLGGRENLNFWLLMKTTFIRDTTNRRLRKNIGLFCKRGLQKRSIFWKRDLYFYAYIWLPRAGRNKLKNACKKDKLIALDEEAAPTRGLNTQLFWRQSVVNERLHRVANPWALVSNLIYNIGWLYWGTIREWCSHGSPGDQSCTI